MESRVNALFLDDSDERHEAFSNIVRSFGIVKCIHARTAWEAIEQLARAALQGERFELAFLDHDLGDDEKNGTGMDVVDSIVDELEPAERPREVIVHSENVVAAPRMVVRLQDRAPDILTRRIPFSQLLQYGRPA